MDKSRVLLHAGKISPIINKTFGYQKRNFSPRKLVIKALTNILLSLLLLHELCYNYCLCWLDIANPVCNSILVIWISILVLNAIVNLRQAASQPKQSDILPLSPEQKKLMGIKHDKSSPFPEICNAVTPKPKCPSCPLFSLSNISPQSSTPHLPHRSVSLSPDSFNVSQRSFSPDSSYQNRTSPYSFGRSPVFNSSGESFFSHRKSPFFNSPLPEDDYMTDQRTLNSYLKSYFEANQSPGLFGNEFGQSFGRSGASHPINEDWIELSKTAYQLSARSPKSPTTSQDKKDDLKKVASSEYWSTTGVDEDHLREAVARLRQWIVLVILRGLVREIDHVNKLLKHHGLSEIQVGESSLNSLKQVQLTKGSEIIKLAWLIPFLEVTTHQEYLVERLRCLASGGYMSDFVWNKGGSFKGRQWDDDLITDSELIMHLFCVFFDLHLPNDPRYPDGKYFTKEFFVKTPDKPRMSKIDDQMIIHQHQLHPPHYRLVTKDVTYDVPSGQHNMLCSILLFLHHVKTKKAAMLGQVNLGLSGINILYVIEPLVNETKP